MDADRMNLMGCGGRAVAMTHVTGLRRRYRIPVGCDRRHTGRDCPIVVAAVRATGFCPCPAPVDHGDVNAAVGVISGAVAMAITATKFVGAGGRMVGNFTI